jgi:hypothetical protein
MSNVLKITKFLTINTLANANCNNVHSICSLIKKLGNVSLIQTSNAHHHHQVSGPMTTISDSYSKTLFSESTKITSQESANQF